MKKKLVLAICLFLVPIYGQSQIRLKKEDLNPIEKIDFKEYEKKMEEQGFQRIEIDLPKPLFIGTPKEIKVKNLDIKPRIKPLYSPKGTKNIAKGKPLTSSDEEPIIGNLNLITDGDKEGTDGSFVELGPGKQWVQIDLESKYEIYHVLVWHFHQEARAYRDVVVQSSDDKDFIENIKTLFNNDYDGDLGLGIGKDNPYLETNKGYRVGPKEEKSIKTRFLRFYSKGNTSNDMNHYIEIEVYGK